MNRLKRSYWMQLLILSFFLIGAFLNAEARPLIQDILSKGSMWMLNIDGEQDRLILRGGKGSRTSSGGFKLKYRVVWGGHSGVLTGSSDGKNSSQFVKLELTRKNGIKVACRGYIAQETDNFMAGTCGSKTVPGAWYALNIDSTLPKSASHKENNNACNKRVQACRTQIDKLTQSKKDINNKYITTNSIKKRCQSSLKQCYKELSDSSSQKQNTKSFSSFKNQINGHYYRGGAWEKADNVQKRIFPKRPSASSDLYYWLQNHNGALLSIAYGILSPSDRNSFRRVEKQRCNNDIYCEIGFRQQAINCALGIGC